MSNGLNFNLIVFVHPNLIDFYAEIQLCKMITSQREGNPGQTVYAARTYLTDGSLRHVAHDDTTELLDRLRALECDYGRDERTAVLALRDAVEAARLFDGLERYEGTMQLGQVHSMRERQRRFATMREFTDVAAPWRPAHAVDVAPVMYYVLVADDRRDDLEYGSHFGPVPAKGTRLREDDVSLSEWPESPYEQAEEWTFYFKTRDEADRLARAIEDMLHEDDMNTSVSVKTVSDVATHAREARMASSIY